MASIDVGLVASDIAVGSPSLRATKRRLHPTQRQPCFLKKSFPQKLCGKRRGPLRVGFGQKQESAWRTNSKANAVCHTKARLGDFRG
jgi:hypothetical protein